MPDSVRPRSQVFQFIDRNHDSGRHILALTFNAAAAMPDRARIADTSILAVHCLDRPMMILRQQC